MTRTTRLVVLAALGAASLGAMFPEEAAAQQRRAAPRPPAQSHVAVPRPPYRPIYRPSYRPYYRPYYYYPYYSYYPYYYPYYYSPYFYGPAFSFGFSSWYWGVHAQYPYPPYGYRYDTTGSARIQVTPRNAEVFVDGYFVGVVDEFDGSLQRLHVEAGEHEVQIYLEGYKTIRERVLFRPGATLKITYTMQPLAPGDPPEPRPSPTEAVRVRQDPARRPPPPPPTPHEPQGDYGTLSMRVQPVDAVVLVNGEEWDRPEGDDRFFIDLVEGSHRLEVRKEGFKPYTRTVQIRRGQTFTLNVSLSPGGEQVALVRMR